MNRNVSEIQIGHTTYIVEREYVGSRPREELILDRIVECHVRESDKGSHEHKESG